MSLNQLYGGNDAESQSNMNQHGYRETHESQKVDLLVKDKRFRLTDNPNRLHCLNTVFPYCKGYFNFSCIASARRNWSQGETWRKINAMELTIIDTSVLGVLTQHVRSDRLCRSVSFLASVLVANF